MVDGNKKGIRFRKAELKFLGHIMMREGFEKQTHTGY